MFPAVQPPRAPGLEESPHEVAEEGEQQYSSNSAHPNQEVESKSGRVNFLLIHSVVRQGFAADFAVTAANQMSFVSNGCLEKAQRVRLAGKDQGRRPAATRQNPARSIEKPFTAKIAKKGGKSREETEVEPLLVRSISGLNGFRFPAPASPLRPFFPSLWRWLPGSPKESQSHFPRE